MEVAPQEWIPRGAASARGAAGLFWEAIGMVPGGCSPMRELLKPTLAHQCQVSHQ